MRPEYILDIRGEATAAPFFRSFREVFGWDLTRQDFGMGKSVRFVKEALGELAIPFEGRVGPADTVYFTSIVALLSSTGELRGISDKKFYRDAEAIRRLPFEFKVDFLYCNFLDRFVTGFAAWLGQRHLVVDELLFRELREYLERHSVSVSVVAPTSPSRG